MRAIEEALELAIVATSSPSSKEQYNAAYEACERALALLRSMDGQEKFSIHSDVRTTDLMFDLHKVIQEFRDPIRVMTFFHPIGGQAVRLAQLHDELDRWLRTAPIHPSPQTGEPRLTVEEAKQCALEWYLNDPDADADNLLELLTKAAK